MRASWAAPIIRSVSGSAGACRLTDVAGGQQLVELDPPHAECGGAVVGQVRVGDHDRAAVGPQQLDDRPPDVRRPDEADALPPVADRVAAGQVGNGDAAQPLALGERRLVGPQDGRHRVLGHRHGVGRRPRGHEQAAGEGRRGDGVAHGSRRVRQHPQPGRPGEERVVEHARTPSARAARRRSASTSSARSGGSACTAVRVEQVGRPRPGRRGARAAARSAPARGTSTGPRPGGHRRRRESGRPRPATLRPTARGTAVARHPLVL